MYVEYYMQFVYSLQCDGFQYHDTSHKEREAAKCVSLRHNDVAEQRGSEVDREGWSLTRDGTIAVLSLTDNIGAVRCKFW